MPQHSSLLLLFAECNCGVRLQLHKGLRLVRAACAVLVCCCGTRHPHIVELRDVFLTPLHLAAVTEHVDGEDLQTFLANTGGR